MPQQNYSRFEKDKVWHRVELVAGNLIPALGRRLDWRVNRKTSLSVLVSFSRQGQLFYDVSHSDFNRWIDFQRSFIIFVVGSSKDVLVVLAKDLQRHIVARGLIASAEYGDYKLHLEAGTDSYLFRELPEFDLTHFHNSYDLLQKL